MLAACIIICRFMIQRWQIVMAFAPRAAMGLTALACLLLTEALMSGPIRGWTVVEWLNHFKTTQGAISLAVFLIFAALPLVIARQAHIPR